METIDVSLGQLPTRKASAAPPYPELGLQPMPQKQQKTRPETANVFVVQNPVAPPMGLEPQRLTCPHCGVQMTTRIETHANIWTHLVAALFCIVGCVCLAPLPYVIKSCKTLDHYCGYCDQYIGKASP